MLIVWAAVRVAAWVGCGMNVYVPRELTIILALFVYSVMLLGLTGATPGKRLLGLELRSWSNGKVGLLRALVRESLGKVLSAAPLGLGFLWIGLSRSKRGWHDWLAGTVVVRVSDIRRTGLAFKIVMVAMIVFSGLRMLSLGRDLGDAGTVTKVAVPHRPKLAAGLVSPKEADIASLAKLLDEHGKDPVGYAVSTARRHKLTIFGELHNRKENLLYLNQMIPALYHKAGVRCVAMEVCVADENPALSRLVTARVFDRALALQTARHEGWKTWGLKEYWDVFHTVWLLNRSLRPGQKPMRVIGIDREWDLPSLALLGLGDDAVPGPPWERLRVLRLLPDLMLMDKRDEIMARNIEREILEKGERGIVWVGASHAYIGTGGRSGRMNRMGNMLYRKYGGQVFTIVLHGAAGAAKPMEKVYNLRGNKPVGFDIAQLRIALPPLAASRQAGNLVGGCVFLKPVSELHRCTWVKGYITSEMFVANKPFYEAECGHRLRSAEETDQAFDKNAMHGL